MLRWLLRLLASFTGRGDAARKPVVEEVEPRILYSADVNPLLWGGIDPNATAIVAGIDGSGSTAPQTVDVQQEQPRRREIVFVDAAVPDAQKLIDGLIGARPDGTSVEVVQLQSGSDGLRQIGDVLAGEQGIDALHIVSHGDDGVLLLGSTRVDAQTLAQRSEAFAAWRQALGADADILIYGCDVGAGETGAAFIAQLAQLTGADVAASTDATGHESLGGDWVLEASTGAIDSEVAFSATLRAEWVALLPTYQQFTNYTGESEIKSDANWGQTFVHTSGAGTYDVNQISLALRRDSDASAQNITVTLRSGGWNGTVLATATIASSSLGTSLAFVDLGFSTVTLTDGVTYTIRVTTNTTNGKVYAGFNPSGGYSGGNRIDTSGGALSGEDTAFKVGNTATAGISVTPTSGLLTTEGAGTAQFSVVLNSAPTANVTIPVSSSDTGEGTVSTSLLTFTTANWSTPQVVTVTGVNDALADGFQGYSIVLAAATSTDLAYNNLNPSDVQAANADNDITYGQITVDTTSDSADGDTSSLAALAANRGADGFISLREAIVAANNTANGAGGADRIEFNIAGAGPHVINVASALPSITQAIVIDGSTEPDYAGSPVVRVDGAAAGFSGITIGAAGGGSTIRGLMITGFTVDGINVAAGANNVAIENNWIGSSGTGSTGVGNSGVGNSDDGIDIAGSNATITGNVITNSGDEGITIVGSGVTGHLIQGNTIGLDPDGATGNGNTDVGIAIISGSGNTIGGTTAAARNVISRNWEGIEVNTANNVIQGNYIGTDAGGTLNRGNRSGDGIQIQGSASSTSVGGSAAGAGNLIAYNAGDGVQVLGGSGNAILQNTILSNAGLAIDLGSNGVTANDALDIDTGANDQLNFPVVTKVVQNGANLDVTLVLDVPAGNYRIELYQNPAGIDPTRHGEGQVFLGALSVTSTGLGAQTFTGTLTGVTATSITRISATATRDLGGGVFGSTSEFGPRAGLVVSTTADTIDGTTTSVAALISNPGADGVISLREAITAANASAGTDYIYFDITAALAGGVHTITLAYDGADLGTTPDALPTITSPVVINGWTEPDYAGNPIIELNGNGVAATKGLTLGAGSDGSTIRGLIINRFTGTGIDITGSNNHTIQGNWIGLNAAGTAAAGNGGKGIYASNSSGHLIGGTTAATRNVISGNAEQGIGFDNVDNSTISGNYVGTNAAGTADVNGAVANTAQSGVYVANGSSGNVIGGTSAGARNVLSGNNHFGFEVIHATSQNNLLQGNYIGTDATGLVALGNINGGAVFWGAGTGNVFGGGAAGARNVIAGNYNGVVVGNVSSGAAVQGNYIGVGADGVTVLANGGAGVSIEGGSTGTLVGTNLDGSNDSDERNVIAGNGTSGVVIDGAATTGTLLRGNWIGLDAGGNARGNAQAGVLLSTSASNNTVGGTVAGAGNTIAFNGWDGIRLSGTGTGNAFLGNSLYGNVEQAIDIGAQGVTLNDADDPDSGGNNLQNFPRLTLARTNGSNQLTLNGTLDSTANTWFRIEFFANAAQDGSGYGEGQTYLGSALVQTDGSGDATISTTLVANVAAGSFISATATQTNATETAHSNTSEFARNVYALPLVQGALVVDTTNDVLDGDATSISTLLANKGSDGFISLREAVIASNNTSGNDTLNLAAGTYTLTIAGTGDDSSATGDIDIQTNITIAGAGMASTIISGGGIDRVMEVDGSGNLTLADVRLTGGSINNDGGGLLVEEAGGTATLTRVDITGNTISGGARIGGGIHNVGTLVLTDSLVHGNTATGSDGGGISNLGTATITRSSIFGNTARYGGGLHQLAGAMTIENVTVSSNTASSEGGGIDVSAGTLTVRYSTIAANSALGGNGGGAVVRGGTLTIGSSIFADNSSISGGRDLHGTVTSLGFNVIEHNAGFTGTVASDQLGTDPALAALALDVASGQYVHALGSGSIAIDAGGGTPPATDQRGVARDASADVGACERTNSAPVLDASGTMTFTTITEDQTNNAGDLVSSLIASAGGDRITDADGDPEGIAITALASGNGSWEYSLDGGASWLTIGTVTNASALLLRSTDRVRFVPNAADATTASITFRAWDRKVGTAGTKVDTASNGGSSAFSTTTESAAITVTAVNDAPVITSNGGGATAAVSVAENTSAVTTVTRTDVDGGAAVYSIAGGADAARFTINASTGALTFVSAPNYEAPTDSGGNNVYDVTVQVSDGAGGTDTQAIAVTVTPANDNAPLITSNGGGASAAVSVAENQTAVTTVAATDADLPAQTLTYSISGGADAAMFAINSSTGVLTFIAAPNFETPTDAGANNVYDVTVQVSDGTLTDSQAIAVTVTAVNDSAPVITSNGGGATAAVNVAENGTAVTTVTASDADLPSQTLTYSISGGADAARFAINSSTGVLTFVAAPDYEAPTDAGADNVYDVTVQVSDGTLTDTQAIAVTVTAVNDSAPVITSNGGGATAAINMAENATVVTTVTGTDADLPGQTLTYSISGGADAAAFAINSSTGVLMFVAAPNIESPTDAGANNVYDVIVQVSDGTLTDTQAIAVTVTAVNDNEPVITSNGGGATAAVNVAENGTAVTTVTASDADLPGQTLTYSIAGGADAARFAIDAGSGALTFVAAPNYEAPADVGADNVYDVIVQVSDGSLIDTQAIAVTVTAVNDNNPVIGSNGGGATASVNVAENGSAVTTVTASDADLPAQTLAYSISGGADAALFSINAATGVLTFSSAPNFETPADAGANNVYDVTVQVADGNGGFDTQAIAVTVTNVNEAPVITSNGGGATAVVSAAENQSAATTITSGDADGGAAVYSIVGGADAALFAINASSGVLTFVAAPDFEAPADAGADNVYDLTVQVADGNGGFDTQAIAVTVTAVDDNNPVISSDGGGASAAVNVAENQTTVTTVAASDADLPAQTITYSIVGGADAALFSINAGTGTLRFVSARNYEAPTDAGADNVYDVIVQADDGAGGTDTQAIAVSVTPVNEASPVISSNGGGSTAAISLAENTSTVTTVTATDSDLPAPTLTYSISGGADAARFAINAGSGALTFVAAPDHEAPADAGANNVYDVIVMVSDGSRTDTQAIAVTVTPQNDNVPDITSNGGGLTASVSVAENSTAVTTVTATDADLPAQTLTYSIAGGSDAARFTIDANSGALAFAIAPDFEAPADADADNVYVVFVQVSDGTLVDTQTLSVTVTNANEAPVITSNGGGATANVSAAENQSAVTTVTSSDVDGGAAVYSIAGGADAGLFTINASTGALTFVVAPNFEAPADAGGNNVYDVTVQVADGNGGIDTQAIAVTVTNVNEAPIITSNGGGVSAAVGAAENQTAVTTVASSDVDGGTAAYSIAGGADAGLFTINASTGALTFVAAPNFEAPTDAGSNNVYDVTVQVADGNGGFDTQAIAVTVTNVNEAPLITSGAAVNVAENQTVVMTITSTDVDGGAPVYSIVGGADAALFTVNASTGALSFNTAPDFEAPTDAGANNVYDVTVQVSDGNGGSDTQAIAVTVNNFNEAPVITSDGAGAAAAVGVAENQTTVTTVTSSDLDGGAPSYAIVGGADAALFTIDSVGGALAFAVAPDFESPTDAGGNNVYEVTVQVADGNGGFDTQALSVTVANVNEAPAITSNGGGATAAVNAAENQTAVTTIASADVDGGAPSYSIVGGADAMRFTIDPSTGVLVFDSAPNYELTADADGDNVYQVVVQVSDGTLTDTQAIAITVTNVNEAPVNNVPGTRSTPEDTAFVYSSGGSQISISDSEAVTDPLRVTLTANNATLTLAGTTGLTFTSGDGSADATMTFTGSRAAINAALDGLALLPTPDFNGAATLQITTDDQGFSGSGGPQSDSDTLTVNVTAVNDEQVLAANNGATVAEGSSGNVVSSAMLASTDVDNTAAQLIYTLASAPANGTLRLSGAALAAGGSFTQADLDAGRVSYDHDGSQTTADGFDFSVDDSAGVSSNGTFAWTVTPVNDAPVIASDGGGASAGLGVGENSTMVTTVAANDADLPAQTLSYSIAGGSDQALFTIDAATGVLSFVSAPNFESPADVGGDNVYDVIVQVSDGAGGFDTQAIAVTVADVNEAPLITSNGGGATAAVSAAENQTAVTTVGSTDVDGAAPSYSIVGGADAALFTIDSVSGALTFVTAPDFESPADSGGNNVYDVTVQVADGNGGFDTQAIAVTVTNVNEAPLITSDGGGGTANVSAAENQTVVTTVTSGDVDGGAAVYSIAGGADAGLFSIDASTGALTFVTAPNFEAPADAGGNNVYDVTVQVSDGNGGLDTQAIAVTVTNVNEAPVITSNGGGAAAIAGAAENQSAVTTVTSSDVDGGVAVYSIAGGADAALFTIDATTGALTFVTAPNFEVPADAGADNVYDVTVQVADGNGGFDTQAIAVAVTNVNEAPLITSNGGGATAALSALENQTAVTTLASTDVDGGAPSYSVVGGADAALFTINASTGALSFNASPNFESPADAGSDNVYDVIVQVADGNGGADTQAIAVTVTNVNEAPVITSNGGGASASVTMAENQGAVAVVASTDVDGGAAQYSIAGGADAAHFAIDAAAGTLSFVSAPDFEAPADADRDNVYQLVVSVADGNGGSDQQTIAVAVSGVNEAPGNIAPAAITLTETARAGTVVAIVTASDPDAGDLFTFTLVNDGAGRFVVDPASGRLQVAPGAVFDFEAAPSHTLVLRVTDAQGLRTEQTIVVTLRDLAEGLPDLLPPDPVPTPAPAPAPAPAEPAAEITPVVLSKTTEIVRGDGREPSAAVSRGGSFVEAFNGESDRASRGQPQRGRSVADDAPLLVASVSFGLDGGAFGGWSEGALDALLQPQREGSALRSGLFSLRGSSLEAEADDGASRTTGRGADEALLAAVQDPVRVASATLTAGFVWWLTRSGGLLTSILMGIPAWRHVDLLPVLAPARDDEEDDGRHSDHAELDERDSIADEMFSNTSRMFGESRYMS